MAEAVGAILLATLSLYAVLAGADFGGGFWDLAAGGADRGREPRRLIDETITPVWEANHVWLVFALVIFWTAFPTAFAAVMTTLALPMWFVVFGIVLRGAGFAFRKEVHGLRWSRVLGATFAFSSLVTPFFMGSIVGAVAAGKVGLHVRHASLAAWTQPTSLLVGGLFVAMCAYLASVYLVGESERRGSDAMRTYFIRRATLAGAVSGALSLATLVDLRYADHAIFDHLTTRALPLLVVGALAGLIVLALLVRERTVGLRVLSALGVAAVVWGWGIAQYPVLLPGTGLTLSNGSSPTGTLAGLVVIFTAAALLVGPAFLLLFWLHGRGRLESETPRRLQPVSGETRE